MTEQSSVSAAMWRLQTLNAQLAPPKLNTGNDAAEYGKGHGFATSCRSKRPVRTNIKMVAGFFPGSGFQTPGDATTGAVRGRLVAKRRDSHYEPGQRSGAWRKMRVNQGQQMVIGGYTPSMNNFDALIVGYYEGGKLMYAARTPNGFTPALREKLFERLSQLETRSARSPTCRRRKAADGTWDLQRQI